MGFPRIRSAPTADGDARAPSEDVELYHRTYTTLLRSSGETWLRVLEPVHRAMGPSLHGLAASDDVDLGALIYACRRLPADVYTARRVVLGQEAVQFSRAGMHILDWDPREAPARRRRWFADGAGTLAVLLASGSDLDDLVPTLVAYQLEWNKLHRLLLATPDLDADAASCATTARRHRGRLGAPPRRARSDAGGGARLLPGSAHPHARGQRGRLRADHASLVEAGAADARRPGRGGPPAVPRVLEHPLPGEPLQRPPAYARGRGGPLDRPRRARRTCAPSSSASARVGRAARGRTSSTTPGETRWSRAAPRSVQRV